MSDRIREDIKKYYDVYFRINAVYERIAKMLGLTTGPLYVLYIIKEYEEHCTQRLICEKLSFPKQTVNTILNNFEKQGYILKEVANHDKRNKHIRFTASGEIYANEKLTRMQQIEEIVFGKMKPSERASMIQTEQIYLNHITNLLNDLEHVEEFKK